MAAWWVITVALDSLLSESCFPFPAAIYCDVVITDIELKTQVKSWIELLLPTQLTRNVIDRQKSVLPICIHLDRVKSSGLIIAGVQ